MKVKSIELWYPRNEDAEFDTLRIGLMDVRAAPDIIISYDFERDGWKIERELLQEAEGYHFSPFKDELFMEVAFLSAWQLEIPKDACSD